MTRFVDLHYDSVGEKRDSEVPIGYTVYLTQRHWFRKTKLIVEMDDVSKEVHISPTEPSSFPGYAPYVVPPYF
ncbi:hypothetical protein ACLOJK_034411 [Asimina triloba]